MSTETQSQTDTVQHIEVTLRKCRVGPLTSRYQNGKWVDVDPKQIDDEPTKTVQMKMNQKHSGDYKAAYASDPVLVISARHNVSHGLLKETLANIEVFRNRFSPIDIACHDGYEPGFKTPTEDTAYFESFKKRLSEQSEFAPLEGPEGVTVFLPTE